MKKTILLVLFLLVSVYGAMSQASVCENAVPVSLPYTTTDDTANYGNAYSGTPGEISQCGTPNSFLGGNDVVYAYTATADGSINLNLSTDASFLGLFAYASCADIGQNCLAGTVMEDFNSPGYISIDAFPVISGLTYYFVISTWPAPLTAAYHLNILDNTCVNPVANYLVVSECSSTDQYYVDINIESLGSATSVTISDDYGNPTQNVTDMGVITFGPYHNGTPATFTVANDDDTNCFITSAPQNQTICQPINNFCSTAIDLSLLTSPLSGTTVGSTNQNNVSCSNNPSAGDVYYSIVVPNTNTLSIHLLSTSYDSMVSTFFGSCDELIELNCFDDESTLNTYTNNTGEDQTFYWVQDGFNGAMGTFTIEWSLSDCVAPESFYTVVPDCEAGEQFLVIANVFSFGSANSVTVSDNQGSATQNLNATGEVQFGPYQNGTQVIFSIANDDDSGCVSDDSPIITQEDCPPTCTNATVNFLTAINCPNPNYYVAVEVLDLGTATTLTISDDQGNAPLNVTATGDYQFGPYASYTALVFTVEDALDSDCVLTYTVQSFDACPPVNDNCASAIVLTPGGDMATGSIPTTNEGSSPSPEMPLPSCAYSFFGNYSNDVWYTVEIPASGNITIEAGAANPPQTLNLMDTAMQLYSGECGTLTPIECNGNANDNMNSFATITLTDRTQGEVIYIRAYGTWGTRGGFTMSAYDESLLSVPTTEVAYFSYYPNPVKDVLNFNSSIKITNVIVFNSVGQRVVAKSVNADYSSMDVSNLSSGVYLVKVFADNEIETLKIIKE